MTIFIIVFSIFIMFCFVSCLILAVDPVERYRRHRHPKWYSYYNEAKTKSFANAEFLKATLGAIEYQFEAIHSMYQSNHIAEDDFKRMLSSLNDSFKIFKKEYEYRCAVVDELLHKAHDYAVKHGLKWGLFYDNEQE